MLVAGLKGLKVIDVACGSGDAQTLAVTDNGAGSPRPGRFPEGGRELRSLGGSSTLSSLCKGWDFVSHVVR